MPQPQNIKDFFRRSQAPQNSPETPIGKNKNASNSPAAACETSPLTEPPSSSFLSKYTSPRSPHNSPANQLKSSLLNSAQGSVEDAPEQSFQSTGEDPFVGASFTSQRVLKNGKEVVISSDGEDTDSIASLESPDDLLAQFTKPANDAPVKEEVENEPADTGMSLRSGEGKAKEHKKPYKFGSKRYSAPKHKFTLDSLVTAAIDDNETEASVAKLRAAFDSEKAAEENENTLGNARHLNEGILASTLDDQDDEGGLQFQRLLDAVRRTEAFDQEKSWFFFSDKTDAPSRLEFPRDSIAPGTYMAGLREPESRERAFHSGIMEIALSRQFLPDELIMWIFQSVSSEPRDGLRQAYCRVFKHVNAERIKLLIRPEDINALFQRLGASPKAMALSDPIVADAHPAPEFLERQSKKKAALLSVLDMLRGAAELFADDARERILYFLFRLALDTSLTGDALVCSELESTITAALEGIPENKFKDLMHRTSITAYDTIKDPVFQSRLLQHILATSSQIALFRCRLALAFLTLDPSPLKEAPEAVFNVERIIELLNDQRFNMNLYKRKDRENYDYGDLGALAMLLNIVIDPGYSGFNFPDKETEREFNSKMDVLASEIKRRFSSIEDSGASHLKRTLAKESLETLYYRIIYSVRSKPPPKKTLLGSLAEENRNTLDNHGFKRFVKVKKEKDTNIPIRGHEGST